MSEINNYNILITDTGESYNASPDDTLLKGMERLGRKGVPVGCRGGGCGVCKVRILSGQIRKGRMSRDKLSEAEEAAGCVLACRVWAESDVSLAVVGQMGKAVRRKNVAS